MLYNGFYYYADIFALCEADSARHPGSYFMHRRLRRRGPRSFASRVRRTQSISYDSHGSRMTTPALSEHAPGEGPRESGSISPAPSIHISILHLNIRGYLSHRSELQLQLKLMTEQPTIIIMNEIFLDNSTPSIDLDEYVLISRRDRQDGSGWGGICCFARRDFQYCIVEILRSNVAERIWHVMHTSCGPYILGMQYRRPDTEEVDSIHSLEGELQQIQNQAFGLY